MKVIWIVLSLFYCILWLVWFEEFFFILRSLFVLFLSFFCFFEILFFVLIDWCDWYGFGFWYLKEIFFVFYNSLLMNVVNLVFIRNFFIYSFVWIVVNKSENFGYSWNKSFCIRICLIFRWNLIVFFLNVCFLVL